MSVGANGLNGKGGIGGKEIASKKKFRIKETETRGPVTYGGYTNPPSVAIIESSTILETQQARNGNDGVYESLFAKVVAPINSVQAIVTYKNYMREYFVGNVMESDLRIFLNYLDEDVRIQSLYDTLNFIHEFLGLENHF